MKTLIRLGGCRGLSDSSLGAQSFRWFCHEVVHLKNHKLHNSKVPFVMTSSSMVSIFHADTGTEKTMVCAGIFRCQSLHKNGFSS